VRISKKIRDIVRQRAHFACEFCTVTETDCGGLLTIDHYQPRTKSGEDHPDNLIYCCPLCNQFKANYFPANPDDPVLWNPRRESHSRHFLGMEDGHLFPITPIGIFTLKRLRLNRPPLIAYRQQKQQRQTEQELLKRFRELTAMLEQVNNLLADRLMEQQHLLQEQQELLNLLLKRIKK